MPVIKKTVLWIMLACAAVSLSGCGIVGDKSLGMHIAYGATAVFAVGILAGYIGFARKRKPWFLLLMGAVAVVSAGYFALSVSNTLNCALMANRVAYLGSVFLPVSMLMIIAGEVNLKPNKWLVLLMFAAAAFVFIVAASPGYSDIYYAEVTLAEINGATVLQKVYGPWHGIYLAYLFIYFAATIGVVLWSAISHRVHSVQHAVLLAAILIVNVGVWFIEQLVRIDFEMLAVTYIICEMFLVALDSLNDSGNKATETVPDTEEKADIDPEDDQKERTGADRLAYFAAQLPTLTATERLVFELYAAGRTSKEIMAELDIKENTLKYHNKNIYSKLGISSRKQMLEFAARLKMSET